MLCTHLAGSVSIKCAELQDPQPHVSLAWAPGDCTQAMQHAVEDFSLSEAQQGPVAKDLAWQQQVCVALSFTLNIVESTAFPC